MSRIVVLVGVLLVMLLVPLYLAKERKTQARDKARGTDAAERAIDAQAQRLSAASAPTLNNPDRHGLSFGWAPADGTLAARPSCQGLPKDMANPHRGDCNPYQGDMSCRTVLPLLCTRDASDREPLALATAAAVAGFMLTGRADGDARCAGELGPSWRMATFRDVPFGPDVGGPRPEVVAADTRQRAWVAMTGGQRANCWDPP